MIQDNNKIQDNAQSLQMAVRSRFFAQYWGTKTLYIGGKGLVELGKGGWNLKHPDFFLQLNPVSKLNDKDAIEISKIFGWNHYSDESKIHQVKNFVIDCSNYHSSNISSNENFNLIDYLRSKGYAVPFMEYSVDDLISFGWVQLL